MKVTFSKISKFKSEYKLVRKDKSEAKIFLDAKTFVVHDICHFIVEKNLGYQNGFWGMLAQGYNFEELFGKENVLTEELRFIEKIVGPIQSIYLGHFKKEDFRMLTGHLNFDVNDALIEKCLSEIDTLNADWRNLQIGQSITLDFIIN